MQDPKLYKKSFHDPTATLEAAIEKLELLAKEGVVDLDVKEDGKLIATSERPLERIIGRARKFISTIFSKQVREEQKEKLSHIKEEILKAKDIAISHSYLIEKLKQGNTQQQKLAHRFLETIKSYNIIVAQAQKRQPSRRSRYAVYLKDQLLLDEEIKGKQIELPLTLSIKYDSHPAQKTFKELSATFLDSGTKKICSSLSPTHKKTMQLMVDTFRMKAIRMVQTHLAQHHFLNEMFNLIKRSPVEIDGENDQEISMRQVLEIVPGSVIVLTGSFERPSVESKLMSSIPILKKDSFRLSSNSIQTGFPYPSLHTSWALAGLLVDACPLRTEQVPLFQEMEHRKRNLAQALLFDPIIIAKAKRLHTLNKEAFDHNRSTCIELHCRLSQIIVQQTYYIEEDVNAVFHSFYQDVSSAPSAFDMLSTIQQKIIHFCISLPAKKLHEEWLETGSSLLRTGTCQEKSQVASHLMQKEQQHFLSTLNKSKNPDHYLWIMGTILGQAAQSIILQYMSEKMGFAPPMLSDFERKIQICAFQQLLSFLDKIEKEPTPDTDEQAKDQLIGKLQADLNLFNQEPDLLTGLSVDLANELEVYFNSRFYTSHRNKEASKMG
jgi:hypothetical protein